MAHAACEKHGFEFAEAMCRRCGHWFCTNCLVYSFGADKPPFCVQCAILVAGVRSNAGHAPRMSPREIRRELRAQRKAERAAAKAARRGHPVADSEPEGADEAQADTFHSEVEAWRASNELWEDSFQR